MMKRALRATTAFALLADVATAQTCYTQTAVHLDSGVMLGPVNAAFNASGSWTTSSTSIPVASTPAGCAPGELVFDTTRALGLVGNANKIGYVAQGGCGASAITLTTTAAAGSAKTATPWDSLVLSGPVASADSCQFIFSGWLRAAGAGSGSAENLYNNDFVSAGQTYPGASSEQERGIDLVVDTSGLRTNMGDSLSTSTGHFQSYAVYASTLASAMQYGQWNHFLWTANVCTGGTYTQLYINGSPVPLTGPGGASPALVAGNQVSTTIDSATLTAGATTTVPVNSCTGVNAGMSVTDTTLPTPALIGHVSSCTGAGPYTLTLSAASLANSSGGSNDALQFNGGINFSDMAGGFWLDMPSGGAGLAAVEWADVQLWTGMDLICTHGTYQGTCDAAHGGGSRPGSTIPAADLALFGHYANGVWLPVNPSVAQAASPSGLGGGNKGLNGLLAFFTDTGAPATFMTNSSPAKSATNYSQVTLQNYGFTPQPVTSAASSVTPTDLGGQPQHVPGFKWDCANSPVPPAATLPILTCGNRISAGDVLVAVTVGTWTANPGSPQTCVSPQPTGAAGSFNNWNASGGSYNSASGYYETVCGWYYTANATDAALTIPQAITGGSYTAGSATIHYTGSSTYTVGEYVYVFTSSLGVLNNNAFRVTSSGSGTITVACASCTGTGASLAAQGTIALGGFASTMSSTPGRGSSTAIIDYTNVNAVDSNSLASGPLATYAAISVAAPGFTPLANDTALGVFTQWQSGGVPYSCPSGWALRNSNMMSSTNSPSILFCDKAVVSGTATGSVTATMGTSSQGGTGGLIGFTPNP
jgi:hypothetical protein